MEVELTLEEKLQDLSEYSRVNQLQIIMDEIAHIFANHVTPTKEWYEERVDLLYQYVDIDWDELTERFKNIDYYMSSTTHTIKVVLWILINEWNDTQVFDLNYYNTVLITIQRVWAYYDKTYLQGNDVNSLLNGISQFNFSQ
jgi:hypothetical protein